jgi:pimeloyl-ACP methyl ester carboxylesterase
MGTRGGYRADVHRRPPARTVRRAATGLVLLTAFVASSCSASFDDSAATTTLPPGTSGPDSSAPEGTTPGGSLEWTNCDDPVTELSGLQCATLEVPVDPSEPDGSTTSLALARSAATGPADERIGSLILNPGGPGGSGLEFLAGAASAFPNAITDRFDLVSFDPRGVGRSSPVRCLDDEAKDEDISGDLTPDTPEERAVLDERGEALRVACERNNPDLAEHMSTADVAADVDAIREAVGDEQLTYMGFSYGTSIGAVYATEYPDRVRALVLDGSTDPGSSVEEQAAVQASGFERALNRFTSACDTSPRCPLAPDAAARIAAARASLETAPVSVEDARGTRELGPDQFDFGLATALYDTALWQSTARAIADLRDGGADKLLALVDRQTGRQPDGSYDNSSDAQVMVNCSDQTERLDAAGAAAAEARIVAAAPTFGPLLGSGLDGCTDWPVPANPVPTISATGSAPILVVGTVGDPATPYEWSERMTSALGSATLLTFEGDGHTAFLTSGACIQDAVSTYLVDLELPAPGTRCPAAVAADPFEGLSETVVEELTKGGLPRVLAECIVEGIVDQVGEDEFERIVLENDAEELTKLATAQTLACAAARPGD